VRAWRLTPTRHVDTAFTGNGAALYGGRWNRQGEAVVYLSTSLALATLEVIVHATGAFIAHTAIEVELPDAALERLDVSLLPVDWGGDERLTQGIGGRWLARTDRLGTALLVPSVVVDPRALSERNLVVDPVGSAAASIVEVQRFDVVIDARLQ
jgi:RES domain-containing protein